MVFIILYLIPLPSYLNHCHSITSMFLLCRVELSFNQIMNERKKKGAKIHKRTRSESCFLSSLEACCDKSVSLGRRQMSTANWQESFIRRQSQVGHAVLPRKKRMYIFSLGQCMYSYLCASNLSSILLLQMYRKKVLQIRLHTVKSRVLMRVTN